MAPTNGRAWAQFTQSKCAADRSHAYPRCTLKLELFPHIQSSRSAAQHKGRTVPRYERSIPVRMLSERHQDHLNPCLTNHGDFSTSWGKHRVTHRQLTGILSRPTSQPNSRSLGLSGKAWREGGRETNHAYPAGCGVAGT